MNLMDSSRTKEKERISVLKRHHKTKTIPEWLWNKSPTVFQCRRQNPNLKSTESLCKDLEFGVASWSPVSVQIPLRLKTVNAKGASAIINYCLNDYILYKISFPSIFPCFQIYLWKYIIITITFFWGGGVFLNLKSEGNVLFCANKSIFCFLLLFILLLLLVSIS